MMMKTKAVRLYGKEDLRLEEFELPKNQTRRDFDEDRDRQYLHVYVEISQTRRGS